MSYIFPDANNASTGLTGNLVINITQCDFTYNVYLFNKQSEHAWSYFCLVQWAREGRRPWAPTISPSKPSHLTLPCKTTFLNGVHSHLVSFKWEFQRFSRITLKTWISIFIFLWANYTFQRMYRHRISSGSLYLSVNLKKDNPS